MQSKFARDMMAQKLMSENKDNPFNSRFFQPSDAMAAPTRQGFRNLMSKMEQRDKQGTDVFPALAMGSSFAPSAGISDVLGFAPDPFNPGKTLPSFSENIDRGNYLDAGLQTVGAGGDVMLAASAFAPFLLAPAVGMKLTSQLGKTLRGGSKATKTVDDVKPGDIAKVVSPTDKSDGIFAFHGSGQDFDEFKLNKIGTGEGAQAFGSGLYFTDSKDIAKFYKNTVTFQDQQRKRLNLEYKGEKFIDLGDTAQAENASTEYRVLSKLKEDMASYLPANPKLATPEEAKNRLLKRLDVEIDKYSKAGQRDSSLGSVDLADGSKLEDLITKSLQNEKDALLKIEADDIKVVEGKTYEVNIKTVTDNLLDYDKPLSEQSESVKKAIESLKMNISPKTKGSQIYEQIGSVLSEPPFNNTISNTTNPVTSKKVSEKLNSLGVKGIKYNAGKLSGKESNATNFVIFDDKIIDIMAKYGIVGAIGVSAMQRGSGATEGDILPPGNT